MARVSAQWQEAVPALRRAASALTVSADDPPERLYHFTDCAGLIGIFEHKALWASLATSMNDPSEIRFGLELAHKLFDERKVVARHVDLSQVDALAAQAATEARAYVVSFCQNLNLAGQWLHYGRSGSGVAVGFYATRLVREPFALFRVLYDEAEQMQLLRSVVESVDNALDEIEPTLTSSRDKEALARVARELVADLLWKVSPRLKHPAFRAEEEWRLIAYEPKEAEPSQAIEPAYVTFFRGSAGRIVPFKKVEFNPLPAFEVVLGNSCPMRPDELGIRVLMDYKLGTRLTVNTSTVPVRA
jgi:Protein of unknown function (DUF2971)